MNGSETKRKIRRGWRRWARRWAAAADGDRGPVPARPLIFFRGEIGAKVKRKCTFCFCKQQKHGAQQNQRESGGQDPPRDRLDLQLRPGRRRFSPISFCLHLFFFGGGGVPWMMKGPAGTGRDPAERKSTRAERSRPRGGGGGLPAQPVAGAGPAAAGVTGGGVPSTTLFLFLVFSFFLFTFFFPA